MANLLCFSSLPDKLNKGAEDLELPDDVTNVTELLVLLRKRSSGWEQAAGTSG